ncbi:MAG: hypothetical protein LW834_01910 [Cyanobium sp. 49614_E6]|nr:hypothetical protein [Cyanobium sp. 49614_E6]
MALPDGVFQAQYEVHDGYVCGSRPQLFEIDAEDLEDDMNDEALKSFYDSEVTENFLDSGKIYPEPQRVDQFVAWARGQLAKRKMEKL